MVAIPVLIAGTVLLITDPGDAMKLQRMDWHYLFMIIVYFFDVQRSTVQLIRTRRIQREAEKNITLLEILCNPRAALLFEKHLIAGT